MGAVTPHADHVACQCGEVSGDSEPCRWTGPKSKAVRVAYFERGVRRRREAWLSASCAEALIDGIRVMRVS